MKKIKDEEQKGGRAKCFMPSGKGRLSLILMLGLGLSGVNGQEAEVGEIVELAPLEVQAARRTLKPISSIPQTVTLITEKGWEEQLEISDS